jgi:septum formation protein
VTRNRVTSGGGGDGAPDPAPGSATPLVLASASPRRAEILETLGLPTEVYPARVDESVLPGEEAEEHAERLARAKAAAVAGLLSGRWVLAGDTVVVVDDRILGKPRDEGHAVEMLLALQGRTHRVISALALVDPAGRVRSGAQSTEVRFRPFDEAFARGYVATGEPMDKAGAYGIQGLGSVLVEGVEGDWSGVVGLPVPLLVDLLEQAGRPYRFP